MKDNKNYIEAKIVEVKPVTKKKKEIVEAKRSKSYYDNEEIVYWNLDELSKFFSSVDNLFYKMAFLLIYETASRVSEVLEMKFCDIDFSSSKAKCPNKKQRRKNVFRIIKISDTLKALILQYRVENNLNDNDFILTKNSKVIHQTTLNKAMIRYATKCGIAKEKAHPHALRHSRAIHLLDNGANIMLVKQLLGHKSIINTMIYLKYSQNDLAKELDRLNSSINL